MNTAALIAAIDQEIERLQGARALLSDVETNATTPKRGPSRPKGSSAKAATEPKQKRTMSAEGKARIAAAQKKRWAAQKKADKTA